MIFGQMVHANDDKDDDMHAFLVLDLIRPLQVVVEVLSAVILASAIVTRLSPDLPISPASPFLPPWTLAPISRQQGRRTKAALRQTTAVGP